MFTRDSFIAAFLGCMSLDRTTEASTCISMFLLAYFLEKEKYGNLESHVFFFCSTKCAVFSALGEVSRRTRNY